MTPFEKLTQYDGAGKLFDLVINHQYVPQSSNNQVGQVFEAMKELNPKFTVDMGCGACVMEALKQAFNIMRAYQSSQAETKPIHMTFPKHHPKKK